MSYISSELIRSARERKKLTQAALAQMLHISDKTVSKWNPEAERWFSNVGWDTGHPDS